MKLDFALPTCYLCNRKHGDETAARDTATEKWMHTAR